MRHNPLHPDLFVDYGSASRSRFVSTRGGVVVQIRLAKILFLVVGSVILLTGLASPSYSQPMTADVDRWGLSDSDWLVLSSSQLHSKAGLQTRRQEAETLAQAGDTKAMTLVASAQLAYLWGPPDYPQVYRYLRAASATGLPRATASLGGIIAVGLGEVADPTLGISMIQRALDKGGVMAKPTLALAIFNGIGGLPRDESKVARLSYEASEAGNALGMVIYGWCLETGFGTEKNEQAAFGILIKAVRENEPRAHAPLARMYATGRGTTENHEVAADIARVGAARNDPDSMYLWGRYLTDGFGVAVDPHRGTEQIGIAAGRGHRLAEASYGDRLIRGLGIERDAAAGTAWLAAAGSKGELWALERLAYYYGTGTEGVSLDKPKAANLYARAASEGSALAMYSLGVLLDSAADDHQMGLHWYRQAAALNYADAISAIQEIEQAKSARIQQEAAAARAAVARQAAIDQAAAARHASVVQAAALRDPRAAGSGAPSSADILALSTQMKANAWGWRTSSNPGEVFVPTVLGEMMGYQRSVSNVQCTAISTSRYRCSYDIAQRMRASNDQSLAGLIGAFSIAMTSAMNMDVTTSRISHEFVRSNGRWTSTTLQAAIDQEISVSRNQTSSTSPSTSCDSVCESVNRQRNLLQFQRDMSEVGRNPF